MGWQHIGGHEWGDNNTYLTPRDALQPVEADVAIGSACHSQSDVMEREHVQVGELLDAEVVSAVEGDAVHRRARRGRRACRAVPPLLHVGYRMVEARAGA